MEGLIWIAMLTDIYYSYKPACIRFGLTATDWGDVNFKTIRVVCFVLFCLDLDLIYALCASVARGSDAACRVQTLSLCKRSGPSHSGPVSKPNRRRRAQMQMQSPVPPLSLKRHYTPLCLRTGPLSAPAAVDAACLFPGARARARPVVTNTRREWAHS